ncbi:MAG: DUF5362 family protein [Tenericutes bacterium]|nr:DUF5362 family protein [Mycoplasmatota bacterium]
MDKSLLKISGIIAIVVGILYCITIVGAIVGIPLIIGGNKIKSYADCTDEQVIDAKDSILVWTIVFLLFNQLSGILLLIFYIDCIDKNRGKSTTNTTKNVNTDDKYEELEKLKKLYDEKVLTKEEFENEKNRILNK